MRLESFEVGLQTHGRAAADVLGMLFEAFSTSISLAMSGCTHELLSDPDVTVVGLSLLVSIAMHESFFTKSSESIYLAAVVVGTAAILIVPTVDANMSRSLAREVIRNHTVPCKETYVENSTSTIKLLALWKSMRTSRIPRICVLTLVSLEQQN